MVATIDLERLAGGCKFKRLNKLVLRDNVIRLLRLPRVIKVLEAFALEDEMLCDFSVFATTPCRGLSVSLGIVTNRKHHHEDCWNQRLFREDGRPVLFCQDVL